MADAAGVRCVVVEDEPLPRRELVGLLAERGLEVVAQADSVRSACEAIRRTAPDLVFLDIQLGRQTAFDVLEAVDADFDLVFVTAYDRYALRAFEFAAIDYLLKPVDPARLDEALGRRRRGARAAGPDGGTAPVRLTLEDRLFVRDGRRWRFLAVASIVAIEADGDYSRVRLEDGSTVLMNTRMKRWEDTLPPASFVRVHRSTIVNTGFITKVEEWFNRTFRVTVRGVPEPYAMSRRHARRLRR